jgi:hypothetical protein
MRHLMWAALSLLVLPALAADEPSYVTEEGHVMCITQQKLRDAQEAADKRDKKWLDELNHLNECTRSKAGQKAEMVQAGMLSAKIRVYDETDKSTLYWTSPTTVKEVRR